MHVTELWRSCDAIKRSEADPVIMTANLNKLKSSPYLWQDIYIEDKMVSSLKLRHRLQCQEFLAVSGLQNTPTHKKFVGRRRFWSFTKWSKMSLNFENFQNSRISVQPIFGKLGYERFLMYHKWCFVTNRTYRITCFTYVSTGYLTNLYKSFLNLSIQFESDSVQN